MGFITAADAASKSSGSSLTFPILIVLVFVGFYFLMIRPQRRRQQKVQQEQRTVAVNTRHDLSFGAFEQDATLSRHFQIVVQIFGSWRPLTLPPG